VGRNFAALCLLGVLVTVLAPGAVAGTDAALRRRPGVSLFSGVVSLVLTPAAVLLAALTPVGVPVAWFLATTLLAGLAVAEVLVAFRIGGWIGTLARRRRAGIGRTAPDPTRGEASDAPSLLLPRSWPGQLAAGALVVSVFAALPMYGHLFHLAFLVFGLGALIVQLRLIAYRQGGVRNGQS
jgi:hypothetical protein